MTFFVFVYLYLFEQKTAYEMRISDWSSDVCSSDLSTTMEKHDNVFIVGITGPIISRESQAIAGDHLYFLRRGICPFTDIDGGLTWSIESFAGNSAAKIGRAHV